MHTIPKLAAVLAIFGSAGCATHEPVVTSHGVLPQAGTYRFLGEEGPPHLRSPIAKQLAELGLEQSETPDYLVQIGASVRPATVGALVPHSERQQWLRSPSLGTRRTVHGVTVSLTERTTGREVYRSVVEVRAGRHKEVSEDLDPLVAGMLIPRDSTDRPATR